MFPAVSATTTGVNEDLEAFAARFKARRLELGLTQACVGAALGSVCGTAVSQITICRCIVIIIIIIIIIHHYHLLQVREPPAQLQVYGKTEAAAAKGFFYEQNKMFNALILQIDKAKE